MSPRFDGRTALVTDGTGEVGRATALGFARAGATVVAVHRGDEAGAAELAAEDGWDPARCFTVRADPATAVGRAAVLAAVHDRLGGTLDVLVANHATYDPAPLASLPAEAIAESMQANLTSHLQLTQAVLPLLRDGGAVVTLGAAVADRGRAAHTLFAAAKAGLAGFARSLNRELADRRIRVNTVAPGLLEPRPGTDLPASTRARILSTIPLRRFVTPTEVANTVLFLACEEAGAVSGATLRVDGGG